MKACLAILAAIGRLLRPLRRGPDLFLDPLGKIERRSRGRSRRKQDHPGAPPGARDVAGRAGDAVRVRANTRRVIERSAGYAVFSTFGVKLFFAGGTTGKGVVVNNRTQRQTFMRMVQVQGGLGFGINQNRLIFVFTNEKALRNFIEQGWEFGGQANLSAMAGARAASSAARPRCRLGSTCTS